MQTFKMLLPKLFAVLIGFAFLGFSFYSFNKFYKDFNKIKEIDTWLKTQAIILESDIKEVDNFDDDSGVDTYSVIVKYSYNVDNQKCLNDKVFIGDDVSTSDYDFVEEIIRKYPKNSWVDVYYNPNDFCDSVLEKDLHSNIFVLLGMGFGFLFFGGLILLLSFKPKKKEDF